MRLAKESRGLDSLAALPCPGWTTYFTALDLTSFSVRNFLSPSITHWSHGIQWLWEHLGRQQFTFPWCQFTRQSSRAASAHEKARPAGGQAHGSLRVPLTLLRNSPLTRCLRQMTPSQPPRQSSVWPDAKQMTCDLRVLNLERKNCLQALAA